jgi:hypothetical protein
MKRRILGYLLSAASVYLTVSYLTTLLLTIVGNFTLKVL